MSDNKKKKKSWLRDFQALSDNTEIPEMFALWTGMAGISLALGRRVWIDMGVYKIYPNMMIVLVAGSGKCRKSTTIGLLEDLVYTMEPLPNIISQKITPEAFIEALRGEKDDPSEGFVIVDELANFLNRRSYETGLAALLISMYDCKSKFEYRTKSRGIESINNACLGLLGGSTLDWIREAIPVDAVGGGLTSRIMFVYETEGRRPVAWTEKHPDYEILVERLVRGLRRIRGAQGVVVLDQQARDFYENEYITFYEKSPFYHNKLLSGYASRRHVHLLKIALLFSFSEDNVLLIQERHLVGSKILLERAEDHMEKVLNLIVSTDSGNYTGMVRDIIKRSPGISRKKLLRDLSHIMNNQELYQILSTLIASGEISCVSHGGVIIIKPLI